MRQDLFRRKSVTQMQQEVAAGLTDSHGAPNMNKVLTTRDLTFMGIAAIVGAGIFSTIGKASFDGVPYGPLRVQVLAPGFQTFGDDYQVDKPQMQITVKLKRPQKQYSIYDEHGDPKKDPDQKPQ